MQEPNTPASSLADVTTWVGRLPVKEIARLVFLIAGLWTTVWAWGGDYVSSRADDILEQALKRKGMSPGDIKTMQDRIITLNLDVNRVQMNAESVAKTVAEMQSQLESMQETQNQTFDLMKTLIRTMKAEKEPR